MKEFYGLVSFSGRVAFRVEAKDEEQAKDIVFSDLAGLEMDTEPESPVEIEYIEWELIERQAGGNVSEAYIYDMEVYEEK